MSPQPKTNFIVDGMPVADLTPHQGALLDYCASCAAELSVNRLDTLTTPHTLTQHSGGRATAYYHCPSGHTWTCHWTVPESSDHPL